jgi:8-oxo-dGTP pyrophosphatase MutT (NUDIX family)
MEPEKEIIVIVDRHNRVVDAVPRHVMRRDCLIHRATYILVINSRKELFVQKRTQSKDIYPGYFDVAAGGVVLAGESYDQSAERELEEELGISGVVLEPLTEFFFEDGDNKVWGRAYTCIYDGDDIFLQEEEVEWGAFLPLDEVLKMADTEPFTPDGLFLLNRIN